MFGLVFICFSLAAYCIMHHYPPCCHSHLWLETSAEMFAMIHSRLWTGMKLLNPNQPFSGKLFFFCSFWKLIFQAGRNFLHFTLILVASMNLLFYFSVTINSPGFSPQILSFQRWNSTHNCWNNCSIWPGELWQQG